MSQLQKNRSCPCGSGRPIAACCGVYLEGHGEAPTAEALMRSRYTAYVLGHADYLLRTWDPAERPPRLDLEKDRTEWLGLEIRKTERGGDKDEEGRVEFIARFRLHGSEQALHENSRFRRQDGRWIYVDGDTAPQRTAPVVNTARSVGRNEPCPCGSGQKYKRCCGK